MLGKPILKMIYVVLQGTEIEIQIGVRASPLSGPWHRELWQRGPEISALQVAGQSDCCSFWDSAVLHLQPDIKMDGDGIFYWLHLSGLFSALNFCNSFSFLSVSSVRSPIVSSVAPLTWPLWGVKCSRPVKLVYFVFHCQAVVL